MYFARLTPNQLCSPSNRLHCPEKRLEKLPIGVGVFSLFSAKSAAVKLCWRSRVPKTNTGSFPRTALSVNMIFGISGERASRTPAAEMRVSAIAALCRGFFSSAILTASGKVSGVCAVSGIANMTTSAANRTACVNAILDDRDDWLLKMSGIGVRETSNIARPRPM
jgi:hypothetical protein